MRLLSLGDSRDNSAKKLEPARTLVLFGRVDPGRNSQPCWVNSYQNASLPVVRVF